MLRSILQHSTAGFYIFASDSTTPTSGKTGLTITATLSKAGGSANAVSPTITEIGNGLYWIAPIAAHRDTLGEIAWQFSATGAIIAPRLEKVVAVNDQTARFGASDGTGVTLAANQDVRNVGGSLPAVVLAASQPNYAPLTSLGTNAPAGWLNLAALAENFRVQLAAIQSDYAPSRAGDQMSLTSTILTELFADADVTDLVNQIAAKFDGADDLPIQTIANAARDAILNRVLSGNHETAGTVGKLLQFLDALISTRLASGSYTAPDNSTIGTISALLAALTEVVSSVTRFKAAALSQAPGSSGGLTTDQNTKLTEIYDAIYPPTPDDEPLVIVPSEPDTVTGWAVCIGLDGQAAAGIVVTYKLQSPPPRDAGRIFNGSTTGTETSAANGLIQFEGLVPGATYYFTCGASQVSVTIPLDADPEAGYQLPSFTKT